MTVEPLDPRSGVRKLLPIATAILLVKYNVGGIMSTEIRYFRRLAVKRERKVPHRPS